MARKANYETMKTVLTNALHDLQILAGDIMGPTNSSWQDVAGTCAVNLDVLSSQLKEARNGNAESFLVFPSPLEILCPAEE